MRTATMLLCSVLLALAAASYVSADPASSGVRSGLSKSELRQGGKLRFDRRQDSPGGDKPKYAVDKIPLTKSSPQFTSGNDGDQQKGLDNEETSVDKQPNTNGETQDNRAKASDAKPETSLPDSDAGNGSELVLDVLDNVRFKSIFWMSTFLELNLNYGDTGLLAEMIYNKAFQTAKDAEFSRPEDDHVGTGSLAGWLSVGQSAVELVKDNPLSAALPASARISYNESVVPENSAYKGYCGIKNRGFWGMPVRAGETYTASWWIRADSQGQVQAQNQDQNPGQAPAPGQDANQAQTQAQDPDEVKNQDQPQNQPQNQNKKQKRDTNPNSKQGQGKYRVDVQYGLFDWTLAKNFGGGTQRLTLTDQWQQVRFNFTATQDAPDTKNVFALVFDCKKHRQMPSVNINLVSLFPSTWRDTVVRKDAAKALQDFRPRAIRSPGGNDLSGFSDLSRFRWNNTIGPYEQRPGRAGNWCGWNTETLGVVELYNFIRELGSKLIVGLYDGTFDGQTALPASQMGPVVDEQIQFLRFLLDTDGPYADMRVKAGGPREPYELEAVMIGNENAQTAAAGYEERFHLLETAIKAQFFSGKDGKQYPDFDIIATAPVKVPKGRHNALDTLNNPRYWTPQQFVNFYHEYDTAERNGTIYYNMEFSVINSGDGGTDADLWFGPDRLLYTTLQSSLAEGIFLLGLERNGDICGPAAHAPQMADHADPRAHQSTPGQLIFDSEKMVKSSSFLVQQAFGRFRIDSVHDYRVNGKAARLGTGSAGQSGAAAVDALEANNVYFSVGSNKAGSMIVKLINYDAVEKRVRIRLPRTRSSTSVLHYFVTADSPRASNTLDNPDVVTARANPVPQQDISNGEVSVTLKPFSMNVIATEATDLSQFDSQSRGENQDDNEDEAGEDAEALGQYRTQGNSGQRYQIQSVNDVQNKVGANAQSQD